MFITRVGDNSISYSWSVTMPDVYLGENNLTMPNDDCHQLTFKPTLVKLVNSKPYTIAFWSDGTQKMATCLPEDEYSPKRGLFICRMKKKYGSWTAYELAKQAKQENKIIRRLLRQIARKVELENALIINTHN